MTFVCCENCVLTPSLICFSFFIKDQQFIPSLKLRIISTQRHLGFSSIALNTISPPFNHQLKSLIFPDETFSSPIHSQLANVIVIGLRGGVQGYYFVVMVHSHQLAHCSPATSDKTSSFSQHFPKAQSHKRKIAAPLPNSRCKDKKIWSRTVNK